MRGAILAFIVTLFFAVPSGAVWDSEPGTGGTVRTVAIPGHVLFYDFADTGDSGILNTRDCTGGVSILFNSNVAGATHTATIHLYACVASSGTTANVCERVISDAGDVALDGAGELGRSLVFGPNLLLPFVLVDVVANPATATAGRVALSCQL